MDVGIAVLMNIRPWSESPASSEEWLHYLRAECSSAVASQAIEDAILQLGDGQYAEWVSATSPRPGMDATLHASGPGQRVGGTVRSDPEDTNKFDKEVSVADLKGNHRTGNKGFCDLLIYKHALKRQLFQREAPLRANDILINTDVRFTKWLENDIEPRMRTFNVKAWMQTEADGKTSCGARAGLRARSDG
jgi:hypothetical protein